MVGIMPSRKPSQKPEVAARLLAWYDVHRRVLPWRAPKGRKADPYRVWLSEIMLQQTTVQAVAGYYRKFLERWPTVQALAAANEDDVLAAWAGLGASDSYQRDLRADHHPGESWNPKWFPLSGRWNGCT